MKQVGSAPTPRYVDPDKRDEILAQASARHSEATITRFTHNGWDTYRARFAGGHPDEGVVLLEPPRDDQGTILLHLKPGDAVGVTFRHGHGKCIFAGAVVGGDELPGHHSFKADDIVLQWPDQLQMLQRRLYTRAGPPPDQSIDVSFWFAHGGGIAPRSPAPHRRRRTGRLENLSAGGLCMRTGDGGDLIVGDRVSCVIPLQPGGEPMVTEGRVRHAGSEKGAARSIGIQFLGLEASEEGQRRLAQLAAVVSGFQKAARRDHRLSTSP